MITTLSPYLANTQSQTQQNLNANELWSAHTLWMIGIHQHTHEYEENHCYQN